MLLSVTKKVLSDPEQNPGSITDPLLREEQAALGREDRAATRYLHYDR